MITINSFNNKIKTGTTLQLNASGGNAPYTWSIVKGNGSVDSNGKYTAPNTPSVDVVRVVDNSGDTANKQIFAMHPIQLVADIIQMEMGLDDDQVYLYNQKFFKPKDERLYVAVGVMYERPFGASAKNESVANGMEEVKTVNMLANLNINVMSLSDAALWRKSEIITALNSQYSQTQRTANGFLIASHAEQFQDVSELDGSEIPYRFETTVNIHYADVKRKSIRYYDDFRDVSITTEA